ncbi:MAG: sensor histidine kinase [Actinomycetota bacterium]
MGLDPRQLTPFLLRQVRAGLVATAMVVAALGVSYFALDHEPFDRLGLGLVLGLAAGGSAVIAVLPWRRHFQSRRGMHLLYTWSALDILLVSGAIAATGAARSDLYLLYSLTTFFFVASYPPVAQVLLLGFTAGCYTSVLALSGWGLTLGGYAARLSMLGVIAYLAGYLSRELVDRAAAEAEARAEANQRATLVSQVADAGRDMTLDPSQVVDVAVEAVVRLGFGAASFVALREDGTASHVAASRGALEGSSLTDDPACGVAELVAGEGATVIDGERSGHVDGTVASATAGVVASPVWVDGWLAAVLIGRTRAGETPARHEVEAFELLATQAGFALDNAGRYNEQRRTVERLEEADRLKSDFVTTVSHELRTPLTSILGNAATLEQTWDRLDDETRLDLLARLTGNARALETKITDLLDFSTSGSEHRPDETFGELDLSQLLAAIGRQMAATLSRHAFRVDVPPGLVTLGDPGLLTRVVGNLLTNAATHTPPGTGVLLSARPDDDAGIVVSVVDDGPGIREADLAYLGDRFYRGGDINVRPGGLGLGLALANEILGLHGSSLAVESGEGRGSTFWFRLPRPDAEIGAPAPRPDEARLA